MNHPASRLVDNIDDFGDRAWTLTLGELSRDRYLTALNRMATLFSPPLSIEVIGVTDGGDRVAVEARSTGTLPDSFERVKA